MAHETGASQFEKSVSASLFYPTSPPVRQPASPISPWIPPPVQPTTLWVAAAPQGTDGQPIATVSRPFVRPRRGGRITSTTRDSTASSCREYGPSPPRRVTPCPTQCGSLHARRRGRTRCIGPRSNRSPTGNCARPAPLARLQETVVFQVIVVIRNQDGEQYATVKLRHLRKGFHVRAEPVGDVGAEARFASARLKQGLRGRSSASSASSANSAAARARPALGRSARRALQPTPHRASPASLSPRGFRHLARARAWPLPRAPRRSDSTHGYPSTRCATPSVAPS